MTARLLATLLTVATLAACAGDEAPADAERDLGMPPADSLPVLSDLPAPAGETPAPPPPPPVQPGARPAPAPVPTPAPAPAPAPPPAAATPVALLLPAGTAIELRSGVEISSRTNKAGETFTATVASAVTDDDGRTVIPAGATVTMLIVALAPAANRGDTTGTLQLRATQVTFEGESLQMDAPMTTAAYQLKGRGVTAGDAAKVGVGAAAGAVAGRVLGGGGRGAVVGGVIGAATGAAIAAETADRDVVIAEGARIVIALRDPLLIPPR